MSSTARTDRLLKASLAEHNAPIEPVKARVDWASIGRMAAIARERRAEMGAEAYDAMIARDWNMS
jgi:hypothetical protein